MMLADIRPLLTEQVHHLLAVRRDIYGQALPEQQSTSHPARIIYMQGKVAGPASGENMADAKAIVWLLNHPRSVATGDTFKLPTDDILNAIGTEHRISGSDTLTKVYLS
jgi:hypothetical protein